MHPTITHDEFTTTSMNNNIVRATTFTGGGFMG